MDLFLKGLLIGIAKIIPGVSGAMIAVNFGVYDKLIDAITNFFNDKRNNFKFLFIIGIGILFGIVGFSNIVRYFIDNYYMPVMMLFIGLIVGGTLSYSKNIKFSLKNILIILLIVLLIMIISFGNISSNYVITGTSMDYLMFFIGGVIEIFSSIVPGISGTALFMLIGIYDSILMIIGNVLNLSFVINNIGIYISYGIGMFVSFIVFSLLISYIIKKYRSLFDTIVFGLSISSILLLIIMVFNSSFLFLDLVVGVVLFFVGVIISYLFDK